jgi:hypothetical protein
MVCQLRGQYAYIGIGFHFHHDYAPVVVTHSRSVTNRGMCKCSLLGMKDKAGQKKLSTTHVVRGTV